MQHMNYDYSIIESVEHLKDMYPMITEDKKCGCKKDKKAKEEEEENDKKDAEKAEK